MAIKEYIYLLYKIGISWIIRFLGVKPINILQKSGSTTVISMESEGILSRHVSSQTRQRRSGSSMQDGFSRSSERVRFSFSLGVAISEMESLIHSFLKSILNLFHFVTGSSSSLRIPQTFMSPPNKRPLPSRPRSDPSQESSNTVPTHENIW